MFENITTSLKKLNNLKKKFFFLKEIKVGFSPTFVFLELTSHGV